MTISEPNGQRLAELDGLRGIAILLVLAMHFTIYGVNLPSSGPARLVYKAMQTGWVGVDLFFVLSGFLITTILLRAKGGPRYFTNFYARRTLRIFPLYFGVLLVAVALLPKLLPESVRLHGWAHEGLWYWTYTGNVMNALYGWSAAPVQGLNHFWSLAVEEQFYALWPVVVYFLDGRSLVVLCASCGVVSLVIRALLHASGYYVAAYVLMPARMDTLAAGALVALLVHRCGGFDGLRRRAWWVAASAATAIVTMALGRSTFNPEDAVVQTLGYTAVALFFAAVLVIVVAGDAPFNGVLRSRALNMFGRYSYGLYVIHHPMLFLLPVSALAAVLTPSVGSPALARVVGLVLVFSVCLIAAAMSWRLFEEPMLRYKRYFESAVRSEHASIAVARSTIPTYGRVPAVDD